MNTASISLGGARYPVVLPSRRDARLHVAAVIVTIHVLGQVDAGFQVSVPQILAAILTCAVIEVDDHLPHAADVRVAGQRDAHRQRRRADPARAEHASPATTGAPMRGGCSPASPRSPCRPSTSSATAARTCSTRRTSGWSSSSSCSAARASSRSTSGGRRSSAGMIAGVHRHPGRRAADHRPPRAARRRGRRSGLTLAAGLGPPRHDRVTAWSPAGRSPRCAASTTGVSSCSRPSC